MAALSDAVVANLATVIEAARANTGPLYEQIKTYVFYVFRARETREIPGWTYAVGGHPPQDVSGCGAAILAQLSLAGITPATGGVAPELERIGNAVLTFPYDRAVNPPSWQQPNLPAGAPGP